ncbi:hypothetical protein JG687_00015535 [Phytophthora cactorum]|uniref:Uncharacterized protein n=1 Tax=Phytophthora cactorum TaxID=29920 RepID=A0A8T1TTG6_9STRA|nr:hypothetical protein JG687_00015535 [Phytophthora cactorum]
MDEVDAVAVVCKTSENVVITTGETGESSPPSGAGLGGELGKDEAFVPAKDEKEAERNCGSEEAGKSPTKIKGAREALRITLKDAMVASMEKVSSISTKEDVIEKQEDDVKASEKETTATEPEVSQNACVWLKNKDLEVPEKVGLEVDSSVSLQRRVVASGETGDYRKLPPLRDKDDLEETAESGLRYYLKNEGCADDGVESVMEWA